MPIASNSSPIPRQSPVVCFWDSTYRLPVSPGARDPIEARRRILVAAEGALSFDPGRNAADLAVWREKDGRGKPNGFEEINGLAARLPSTRDSSYRLRYRESAAGDEGTQEAHAE